MLLPPGFQRIRYFGLMANRRRKQSLALCRTLLTRPQRPTRPTAAFPLTMRCRLAHADSFAGTTLSAMPIRDSDPNPAATGHFMSLPTFAPFNNRLCLSGIATHPCAPWRQRHLLRSLPPPRRPLHRRQNQPMTRQRVRLRATNAPILSPSHHHRPIQIP